MKCRIVGLLVLLIVLTTAANGQEVIFGTNNYVEYQVGTLPFIISVSHGGNLEPASIPNRTCNNPVFDTDAFTIETATEIKNRLFALTGCYPHVIISHLKRNKLDPNRNLTDGTCGNTQAITAWNEFHGFITNAQNAANQQYNNQTFFVDLHGHGNAIQRIELGYLLYDDELELPDNTLNTTQYINYSSIKNLALSNANNYTHVQLLRGPNSFGTLLSNANFPSVPSQSIPFPGTNTNYFSGGYITVNHTSYTSGILTNGLQMELNYSNIRDLPANRTSFALAFSNAIIAYMNTHFNVTWSSCSPLKIKDSSRNTSPELYPNPIKKGASVYLNGNENTRYVYKIFNSIGQNLKTGTLELNQNKINTENLDSGMYLIQLLDQDHHEVVSKKLIVH